MTEKTKQKPLKHYVDNKEFLVKITEYRNSVLKARAEEKPRPRVPEYIGSCLFKIATHLSRKPNFSNYTFKDDMISDGVENCLLYIDNFNPEKSNNPFSYFTQIIYYAFLRRIQKEKKHLYIKYKTMENEVINTLIQNLGEEHVSIQLNGMMHDAYSEEFISDFIQSFEATKKRKSESAKKNAPPKKKKDTNSILEKLDK